MRQKILRGALKEHLIKAIIWAENGNRKGSKAQRLNNPGMLRKSSLRKYDVLRMYNGEVFFYTRSEGMKALKNFVENSIRNNDTVETMLLKKDGTIHKNKLSKINYYLMGVIPNYSAKKRFKEFIWED